MTIESITIDPPMRDWPALVRQQPQGQALGRPLEEWRRIVRDALNLLEDRHVVATGHQPALWHPGILAKYMAAQAFARRAGINAVDVIVSQDIVQPAVVDVPVRRHDGVLAVRTVDFASRPDTQAGRDDVPIVAQPAFAVRPFELGQDDVLPSVREGLQQIRSALQAGAQERNAAVQMMIALQRLMGECGDVHMTSRAMSSESLSGEFGFALLRALADDPRRCAVCYNAAVAAVPEARLAPLAIRDDLVEVPLWRVHEDGGRMRAYDSDVEAALEEYGVPPPRRRVHLMPRALTMTAMDRLAACDIFIHGTGGAIYDRAMERWIRDWLGVEVSPMATVSATVHLPLMDDEEVTQVRRGALDVARHRQRWLAHDPELADVGAELSAHRPGAVKQALLREIDSLPPRSPQRRAAFFEMHRQLEEMRREHAATIDAARCDLDRIQRLARDADVASRRDWAFPLYPRETLMDLSSRIHVAAGG